MDFDAAIKAHSDWKGKLKQYIAKPDGSINEGNLGKHDHCLLGQWLHNGEAAKQYASFPQLAKLIEAHKAFHKAAGEIVEKVHKGVNVSADVVLSSTSPFATHSMQVVTILMEMKRHK